MDESDPNFLEKVYHLIKHEIRIFNMKCAHQEDIAKQAKKYCLTLFDQYNRDNTERLPHQKYALFYVMASIRKFEENQQLSFDELYSKYYGKIILFITHTIYDSIFIIYYFVEMTTVSDEPESKNIYGVWDHLKSHNNNFYLPRIIPSSLYLNQNKYSCCVPDLNPTEFCPNPQPCIHSQKMVKSNFHDLWMCESCSNNFRSNNTEPHQQLMSGTLITNARLWSTAYLYKIPIEDESAMLIAIRNSTDIFDGMHPDDFAAVRQWFKDHFHHIPTPASLNAPDVNVVRKASFDKQVNELVEKFKPIILNEPNGVALIFATARQSSTHGVSIDNSHFKFIGPFLQFLSNKAGPHMGFQIANPKISNIGRSMQVPDGGIVVHAGNVSILLFNNIMLYFVNKYYYINICLHCRLDGLDAWHIIQLSQKSGIFISMTKFNLMCCGQHSHNSKP